MDKTKTMTETQEHKNLKLSLKKYFESIKCKNIELEKNVQNCNKKLRPDLSFETPNNKKAWVEVGNINCEPELIIERLHQCYELNYSLWFWCPKKQTKRFNSNLFDFFHSYPNSRTDKGQFFCNGCCSIRGYLGNTCLGGLHVFVIDLDELFNAEIHLQTRHCH